ncbi:MAG: hypothetical protein KKD44_12595 [Proteobacteria bacterium]|nr:hypothetical protein [Pseudomonadota bacterium]
MPDCNQSAFSQDTSHAKLLMCALLISGADREIKDNLVHSKGISSEKPVEDAVLRAYHTLTQSSMETKTARFRITRT